MQPVTIATQLKSDELAIGSKLNAKGFVQPKISPYCATAKRGRASSIKSIFFIKIVFYY